MFNVKIICGNGYTLICHNNKNTEIQKDILMTEMKPFQNTSVDDKKDDQQNNILDKLNN